MPLANRNSTACSETRSGRSAAPVADATSKTCPHGAFARTVPNSGLPGLPEPCVVRPGVVHDFHRVPLFQFPAARNMLGRARRTAQMDPRNRKKLEDRVIRAAEAALAARKYVSPVDVLVGIGWLDPGALA